MFYVILGCLVLLVLVSAGRRSQSVRLRPEWRFLSAAGALAAFVAAGLMAFHEAWVVAIPLIIVGAALLGSTRIKPRRTSTPPQGMSLDEARSMLGVGPEATPEQIQSAYRRLMERVHPDKGGASGLAAQLNAARDRLLRR